MLELHAALIALAARLADCQPADLLALHLTAEGNLIVVVRPDTKHTFTAEQVQVARDLLAKSGGHHA